MNQKTHAAVPSCVGGDIDPLLNLVEVTEEAKEELAKIQNKIGEYACRLCKEIYSDAFGLAQHRYSPTYSRSSR